MARPNRYSVDYFPHQCNHGKTMFILEQKWGNDGYAFWFKLLEILGSTDGHYICVENPGTREFLSAKTHLEIGLCHQILDLLAELDAIDRELWETEKVVWCQHLVDNIAIVYQKRTASVPQKPIFRNHKLTTSDVSEAETQHNEVSDAETPQSIVEESIVDKSKEKEINTHAPARAYESAQKAKRTKFVKDLFEKQFWQIYPRKKAKQDALKAFLNIFPISVSKEKCNERWKNIVLHVEALKAEARPPDKIPYPATFLRRESFDEPPSEAETTTDPEFEFVEVEQ